MPELAARPRLAAVPSPDEARREALRELYAKHAGSVYGRCRYLLRDRARAEDATQEVFARALRHHETFRDQASPLTWLMKIATHHCLNELRADRALWHTAYENAAKLHPVAEDGARALELRETVRRLLGRFDAETQAAAVHYHVDGMTLEEVASVLERSVPTIRKRLEAFARLGGQELAP